MKRSVKRKRWVKQAPKKKIKWAGEEFASIAECDFAKSMTDEHITWQYEPEKFEWWPAPPKARRYTPDFRVMRYDGSYFYVEFKGYLRPGDKTKMRAIKKQQPDVDIRFVFMNAYKYASKHIRKDGTRQTYAEWAESYGYMWAHKSMPEEWLEEKGEMHGPM